MRPLKLEDKQILAQSVNGACAIHLGLDKFLEPIPWGRIRKLIKNGLLKKTGRAQYLTTAAGVQAIDRK